MSETSDPDDALPKLSEMQGAFLEPEGEAMSETTAKRIPYTCNACEVMFEAASIVVVSSDHWSLGLCHKCRDEIAAQSPLLAAARAEVESWKAEAKTASKAENDEMLSHRETLGELERWRTLFGADEPADGCIDGAQGRVIMNLNRQLAAQSRLVERMREAMTLCYDCLDSLGDVDPETASPADVARDTAMCRAAAALTREGE